MLEIGSQIQGVVDRYVVESVAGEGGFGITFCARRESNGEVVALKLLRLERMDSWKALELFEREGALLRTLDHPKIPSYVEFFAQTDEGPVAHEGERAAEPKALVLVQRLVPGRDLAKRLAAGRSFETDEVTAIIRQVLEVLDYLHGLSPPVIHRDVNPRNIVLDDEGSVYLVDFGAIQQKLREQTVGGSTSVGTLGYIPIEQSLGKARPASDLYSLGVTTVVVMTGMQPDDLPLDDSTSKIDLAALGLTAAAATSEPRRRLHALLDRLLEPIVGQRLESAAAALRILDGKEDAKPAEPAVPQHTKTPAWYRTLFILCLGGSLGGAGIIYPLNFNNFSETEMIQMAPFWVLPAAFGASGLLVQSSKRPIVNAILMTLGAAGALAFFFAAIFPAL